MDNHAIPEEVLELILLLVNSLACLVRAASTCKRWRRIVSDAGFRRRFRSIHGAPIVAGAYYTGKRFQLPHFLPSPSATIDGRFFSVDFLPGGPYVWKLKDSRGSLILLDRRYSNERCNQCSDLIICEPLTRRYETLPTSSSYISFTGAFLLDGESAEAAGISMSNFRVLCLLLHEDRTHAAVFTSGSSWQLKSTDNLWMDLVGFTTSFIYFYNGGGTVMSVDRHTAEFSSFVLPYIGHWDRRISGRKMSVSAGSDGEARIVVGEATG
ncbi:hypothetical protein ACP70R_006583 [Stipagrostis hirtigluma subsp. patula]